MHYRDLCKKCIDLWRTHPLYSRYYHEVGVFFRSGAVVPQEPLWVSKGIQNAVAEVTGFKKNNVINDALPKAVVLKQADDVIKVFPEAVREDLGEACVGFNGQSGYFNPTGGWAESGAATHSVLLEAQRHGAVVVPNAEAVSLMYNGYVNCKPRVSGVRTADGREFHADQVILAAGSWTPHALRLFELNMERQVMRPSAHCVLMIKINPAMSIKYEKTPVTFNMSNSFYSFPPNKDGILKCSVHTLGDTHSSPQEHSGGGYPSADNHTILRVMHEEIKRLYPKINLDGPEKNAAVHATRICWYCDTRDENFLIDFHPNVDGLLVASGDSGHAFKVRVRLTCSSLCLGVSSCLAFSASTMTRRSRLMLACRRISARFSHTIITLTSTMSSTWCRRQTRLACRPVFRRLLSLSSLTRNCSFIALTWFQGVQIPRVQATHLFWCGVRAARWGQPWVLVRQKSCGFPLACRQCCCAARHRAPCFAFDFFGRLTPLRQQNVLVERGASVSCARLAFGEHGRFAAQADQAIY